MKGFRTLGKKKSKLMEKINSELQRLAKKGVNGDALLKKQYGATRAKDFYKIKTKMISGMLSDLKQLDTRRVFEC